MVTPKNSAEIGHFPQNSQWDDGQINHDSHGDWDGLLLVYNSNNYGL